MSINKYGIDKLSEKSKFKTTKEQIQEMRFLFTQHNVHTKCMLCGSNMHVNVNHVFFPSTLLFDTIGSTCRKKHCDGEEVVPGSKINSISSELAKGGIEQLELVDLTNPDSICAQEFMSYIRNNYTPELREKFLILNLEYVNELLLTLENERIQKKEQERIRRENERIQRENEIARERIRRENERIQRENEIERERIQRKEQERIQRENEIARERIQKEREIEREKIQMEREKQRQEYLKTKKSENDVEFQVISWEGIDLDDEYLIHIFGRSDDGKSVHLEVPWKPYFFVKGNLGGGLPTVTRKDLWGFQAGKKHIFTQIECRTLKDFRMRQKKYQGRVYEGNLDPILRFMHRTGIHSTGWIRVPNDKWGPVTSESPCDLNINTSWENLIPISRDDIAPFRITSLDIECYSDNGQFPDSMKPSDVCFQIAMTTKSAGEYIDKRVFGVKTEFKSEKDMLTAFVAHLRKIDPDVITGWNIFGFDLEYIYNRLCFCKCPDLVLGRLYESSVEMNYKKLSSSALGNNTLKIMRILGRYTFDMYHEVKREHKFESYSLNNVSKIVLKDQKNDMPVHEIFSRFKSGEGLVEVADYCIKDTELPHAICEKLTMFQNLIEMAKACWVPLSYLSERGQQVKVFSQMAQVARELGFMIPVLPKTDGAVGGYQGATVLEAQVGAYYEPITGLDFASLYPSIMCAHNLCYSTYVMSDEYRNLPNVEYQTFGEHTFAVKMDGKPTESLLPIILESLKKHRKDAKAKMITEPEMYSIYNGKQLAYKISMNSVYGFTGAMNGILPLVAIAASVTMRGRQMIEISKDYVEKNFPGAKVRYGDTDSIMVQFGVGIKESWELGERASKEISQLFAAPNKLELEKVYCPFVLYSKKRYAAKLWKMGKDGEMKCDDDLDVKGLQTVRRDSCPFARRILTSLLEATMESSDPTNAIKIARQAKEDLLAGKVANEELVITKSYRGDDYKVKMPHVTVVEKMKKRNPGSEPQVGSRVAFIIIKNNEKNMADKAEDPVWALENNVKIDYQYYFEHQLEQPIKDLLEPHGSSEVVFQRTKTRQITDFFVKK